MKNFVRSAAIVAGVVALCGFSHGAGATTVTFTQDSSDFVTAPASSSNPAWSSEINTQIVSGSIPDVYRSPFENAATPGSGLTGWQALQYTSVQAGGSVTYSYTSPMDMLTILWGSPDTFNTLAFYTGQNGTGVPFYTITGGALSPQGIGHDLVTFLLAGGTFESIVLSSSVNAFEFSDLKAEAPLPAALPLFASGLGLMGYLARRRKKRKAIAALAAAAA